MNNFITKMIVSLKQKYRWGESSLFKLKNVWRETRFVLISSVLKTFIENWKPIKAYKSLSFEDETFERQYKYYRKSGTLY